MRWILGAALLAWGVPWVGGCRDTGPAAGGWRLGDGVDDVLTDWHPALDAHTDGGHEGCDVVITGDTVLTADVGPCFGDGITVVADDVTLDCAGHAVLGAGVRDSAGVRLAGAAGVTVRNCRVAQFDAGIALADASGNRVEQNTVERSAVGVLLTGSSGGNVVSANVVDGAEDAGFRLVGAPGNELVDNVVTASGYGFFLADATANVLDANVASGNRVTGIHLVRSAGNVLRRNAADDNGVHGLCFFAYAAPNLVEANVACGNGTSDVAQLASEGSAYVGNTFCTTSGI